MLNANPDESLESRAVVPASVVFSTLIPAVSEFGIAIKGLNGLYKRSSRALEWILGLSAEQILGKSDADLFSAEIAERLRDADLLLMEGKSDTCQEIQIPAARYISSMKWVKFPILDLDGTIGAIALIVLGTPAQIELNSMRCSLEQLKATNALLQQKLLETEQQASTDRLTAGQSHESYRRPRS